MFNARGPLVQLTALVLALAWWPPASSAACVDYSQSSFSSLSLPLPAGAINDLALVGDALYVSALASANGVVVLDVSDPLNPTIETSLVAGSAGYMAVIGTHVYVVAVGGVVVLNAGTPLSPAIVATIPIPANARDVAWDGVSLYVLWGNSSEDNIAVYDVSTPATPILTGTHLLPRSELSPTYFRHKRIHGDPSLPNSVLLHYSAGNDFEQEVFTVYDATDPAAFVTTGSQVIYQADQCADYEGTGVVIQGTSVLTTGESSGLCFDPRFRSQIAGIDFATGSTGWAPSEWDTYSGALVKWDSNRAFWRNRGALVNGISEVDFSTPAGPVIVADRNFPVSMTHGVRVGDVIVGAWSNRIFAVDPFQPLSVEPLAAVASVPVETMVIEGDRLYVRDGSTLSIFDVTVPASPTLLGTQAVSSSSTIQVQSGLAYVTRSSLNVYDVSNPASIVALGSLPMTGSSARATFVDGDWLYHWESNDFVLVDVSDPNNPLEEARSTFSGTAKAMAKFGGYVLVTRSSELLRIDPFANPGPKIKSTTAMGASANGLAIQGTHGYIATAVGLSVMDLDLGGSGEPVEIGELALGGVGTIVTRGDFAYVGAPSISTMYVVDITVPTSPGLVAEYAAALDSPVSHAEFLASGDDEGLTLLNLQCDATAVGAPLVATNAIQDLSAAPNPFRARTEFSFTVPSRGHVSLDVFDVTGRRVQSLVNRTMAAGTHSVSWDITLEADLVPGVFFARVSTGQGESSVRVVRLGN